MLPICSGKTEALLASCRRKGLLLATAESCTGGLVAALLTSIAGSSDVFERGFVTYSNRAKEELLGVDPGLLARFGAVSAEVARAMTEGALAHSAAQIALAVTGIAGPGGGSPEKPVGLVYFGVGQRGAITTSNAASATSADAKCDLPPSPSRSISSARPSDEAEIKSAARRRTGGASVCTR